MHACLASITVTRTRTRRDFFLVVRTVSASLGSPLERAAHVAHGLTHADNVVFNAVRHRLAALFDFHHVVSRVVGIFQYSLHHFGETHDSLIFQEAAKQGSIGVLFVEVAKKSKKERM